MIQAQQATKRFGDIVAVAGITAEIQQGSVYGLIGTNGAGKSTFLRMLAGILKCDEGSVTLDDQPIYENPQVKSRFFYISDEQYFYPNATPEEMKQYYRRLYPGFSTQRFDALMDSFSLDPKRKIRTFSKGMKKQVSVVCALSAMTDYIYCDETFDGLDPVMRQAVKGLFAAEVADRGLTPIIASHNLRELEDICDHVGLLHKGGVLLSRDLDELKLGIHKLQVIFRHPSDPQRLEGLQVLTQEKRGSLLSLVVRGGEEQIQNQIQQLNPLFFEFLPLSLEEIFISETEVAGYDVKKILC